ncbi:hypothetical protein ACMD2_01699 [Ananas comosus]|uniref:Uncharacterized protein n=1 Tax=Ananas comosus TaxID=4615 RepID=A0A199VK19_ANACO|nr:hypothetical protein ACMD2_01699 [Ananas comosus]
MRSKLLDVARGLAHYWFFQQMQVLVVIEPLQHLHEACALPQVWVEGLQEGESLPVAHVAKYHLLRSQLLHVLLAAQEEGEQREVRADPVVGHTDGASLERHHVRYYGLGRIIDLDRR